jgi:ubiquitin-protein ligase E3 C
MHLDYFYFVGSVVGRALYEGILLETKFATFFLRKMQGKHNYLCELQSFDKEIYQNLKFLKDYKGDCKDLSLTFTVKDKFKTKEIELVRGGKSIIVTNSNKFDYIYRLANYKMNTQIKKQTQAFLQGMQ